MYMGIGYGLWVLLFLCAAFFLAGLRAWIVSIEAWKISKAANIATIKRVVALNEAIELLNYGATDEAMSLLRENGFGVRGKVSG